MSEPAGWQWIEAWRNGTISDEDFAALQNLLRADPDARRTLRRYMVMDTALRDRAEARLLSAMPQADPPPILTGSDPGPSSAFVGREMVAWSSAAACLLLAALAWFSRPTTNQSQPLVVELESPAKNPVDDKPIPAAKAFKIADQREQLLASAPDVLHLQLVSDNGRGGYTTESGGDIVWSSGQQIGYLRLSGVASDNPTQQRQYQLWIVGSDLSGNEIINGGIFPVDQNTGELILQIQADQFVQQPKMFVVSLESSEGNKDWVAPLMAQTAGL